MVGAVLRILGLTVIYVFVLTSVLPGDIVIGVVLATVLVVGSRATGPRRDAGGWLGWARAVGTMLVVTAWEIVKGSARVVRFCPTGAGNPGFVEIPRDDRSRHAVALWGVLTGEAPDEYPVIVDDERHVLVVHLVDAGDREAVRERHRAAQAGYLRDVVR